jgi:hypothetical protein
MAMIGSPASREAAVASGAAAGCAWFDAAWVGGAAASAASYPFAGRYVEVDRDHEGHAEGSPADRHDGSCRHESISHTCSGSKVSGAQSFWIESIGALTSRRSMIFSENRCPLFRIMLSGLCQRESRRNERQGTFGWFPLNAPRSINTFEREPGGQADVKVSFLLPTISCGT